jgi:hypothetical protein
MMTSVAENAKRVSVNGIGKDSVQIQRVGASIFNSCLGQPTRGDTPVWGRINTQGLRVWVIWV